MYDVLVDEYYPVLCDCMVLSELKSKYLERVLLLLAIDCPESYLYIDTLLPRALSGEYIFTFGGFLISVCRNFPNIERSVSELMREYMVELRLQKSQKIQFQKNKA